MSTTFAPLPSADAAGPALADPADARLAVSAAIVCVADSGDGLP